MAIDTQRRLICINVGKYHHNFIKSSYFICLVEQLFTLELESSIHQMYHNRKTIQISINLIYSWQCNSSKVTDYFFFMYGWVSYFCISLHIHIWFFSVDIFGHKSDQSRYIDLHFISTNDNIFYITIDNFCSKRTIKKFV